MSLVPRWRVHLKVVSVGISDALAYRGSFLLGIVTSLIPLVTSLLLWSAIYKAGGTGMVIAGFDINQMLSYYLVMNVLRLAGTVEDAQWEVTQQVRSGALNNILLRPFNYVVMQWDLRMAAVGVGALLAVLPAAILFFVARSVMVLPAADWQWGVFAVSALLGIQISFLVSVCVGLSAFWFLETSGFLMTVFPLQMILSGALFPLELVPGKLFAVLGLLPWAYTTYFPLQVYLGRVTPAAAAQGLAMQAFWIAALAGVAALMWRRGLRRYEAVGG